MKATNLIAIVLLISLCLAIYWQTSSFEFVNFDDDRYILNNPHVSQGLTLAGIKWAFKSTYAANWHPVTWISHMIDCSLFGLDSGRHHLVNVFLHTANTILLFLVLTAMTNLPWRSAVVAGLFAAHPLHVESVAWVAERKDVLSTLFWLLTLLIYSWYSQHPRAKTYLMVIIGYVLGLMSKPMLVSLPFVLLLLDFWPLGRLRDQSARIRLLILEKIPLFALALGVSIVTFIAQKSEGAVVSAGEYPIGVRLANACVAYVAYLWKTLWPAKLACFYPHPGASLPTWQVVVSSCLLAIFTFAAIGLARRRSYLTVGWFWFVITLLPVIGVIQVGRQAMADRYTYIPLIGVFVAVVWSVAEFAQPKRRLIIAFSVLSLLWLGALSVASYKQAQYWQDSVSLFRRAVSVTENNGLAYYNLGCALQEVGDSASAKKCVRKALDLLPGGAVHYNSYGCDLLEQGMVDMAIIAFQRALDADADFGPAYLNLAVAYLKAGEKSRAIQVLRDALRRNPADHEARQFLKRLQGSTIAQ